MLGLQIGNCSLKNCEIIHRSHRRWIFFFRFNRSNRLNITQQSRNNHPRDSEAKSCPLFYMENGSMGIFLHVSHGHSGTPTAGRVPRFVDGRFILHMGLTFLMKRVRHLHTASKFCRYTKTLLISLVHSVIESKLHRPVQQGPKVPCVILVLITEP